MPTDYVTEFYILSGHDPFAKPPSDFYKIPIDLNHGAGGNLIYFVLQEE